ncbi:MAG: hypothetical protein ACFFFG_11885 [Candidatus Thorarchaeota archaeon]
MTVSFVQHAGMNPCGGCQVPLCLLCHDELDLRLLETVQRLEQRTPSMDINFDQIYGQMCGSYVGMPELAQVTKSLEQLVQKELLIQHPRSGIRSENPRYYLNPSLTTPPEAECLGVQNDCPVNYPIEAYMVMFLLFQRERLAIPFYLREVRELLGITCDMGLDIVELLQKTSMITVNPDMSLALSHSHRFYQNLLNSDNLFERLFKACIEAHEK